MTDNVSLHEVETATKSLASHIFQTPFLKSATLSELSGADVLLKYENLQYTGSFKARGACLRILGLSLEERARGVVAMSAGNHAQAVAYYARALGIRATIVMPQNPSAVKLARTRSLGAQVLTVGHSIDEAREHALTIAESSGAVLIHPYDDAKVILGQSTLGFEMLREQPNLDDVIIAIGGGGLAAGFAIAAVALKSSVKLYGVQARAFPSMYNKIKGTSLESGRSTVADGIAVGTPGALAYQTLKERLEDVFLVSNEDIESAMFDLLELQKTMVEGAGAAGLAALLGHRALFRGRRVGLILCGGNVDPRLISAVTERVMHRRGQMGQIEVIARDSPGSLAAISSVIAELGGNIESVIHKRGLRETSGQLVQIGLDVQTRDLEHLKTITAALTAKGFEVRSIF
jgi:threonine dehydratase